MKIIVLGATGMVGAGTLKEALADEDVSTVLSIGRRPCGVTHPRLTELILPDLFDIASVADRLVGYDACLFAVGVSSMGLDEPAYARMTQDLTLLWARTLLERNPDFSFCYCSAAGAGGRSMWARVRQRVEGALQAMDFRHKGVVRPAFIRPGPGIRSRTKAYQMGIVLMKPLFVFIPFLQRTAPAWFTTSEALGRAMLAVVKGRADRFILESADINRIGA